MDKNNKDVKPELLYPLSMYYEGAIEGVPNLEEQYQILAECREYSEKKNSRVDPYSIDEPVLALNLMMEKLEQYDYFEGVRNIVNNLLTQNRRPQELFRSLFPNSEEKVQIFKSQFSDACDLICMGDDVDWSRMGVSWYGFDTTLQKRNAKNLSLKIDWTPDYWTQEEKDQLFNFWRERYSKIIINMSPSGKPAGGIGFFDSERHSLRLKTYRPTYSENHQVNLDFKKRRESLLKEQEISQDADKYRIELLLNAEYQAWEWWKIKNIYKIKPHDPLYFINQAKEKVFYHEALYKEAFAQLIEYDRENGFAVADPDRDFKKEPMTITEYRGWLEREGRQIAPKSDDDLLLENVWNQGPLENIVGKVPPSMKSSFIPSFLDEYHRNQERSDRRNGIERSRSGVIIKINGVDKEEYILEKPMISKDLKKNTDLKQEIISFKVKTEDNRPVAQEIDLNSLMNPLVAPETDMSVFDIKETESVDKNGEEVIIVEHIARDKDDAYNDSEVSDPIIPEFFNIGALPELPKSNPYSEDLFKGLFVEKEFSEEDVILEKEEDSSSSGDFEQGSATPPWMRNRNFDGVQAEINTPEESVNADNKDKKKRKKSRVPFDRNKQIKEISEGWKGLDAFDMDNAEGSIWNITQQKIKSFKQNAKNLWEDRVSYLLSVDIPEQKALLKIKTQELMAFKDKIMQKRTVVKNNVYLTSPSVDEEEVVKPVSLYVHQSPKPKRKQ